MEKLEKEEILDQKDIMLVTNGFHQSKKIFKMLDRFDEEDFSENKEMLLFKAVSILESAVNERLHQELQIQHGMSHARIDGILTRLKVREKLDWFYKFYVEKRFCSKKAGIKFVQ